MLPRTSMAEKSVWVFSVEGGPRSLLFGDRDDGGGSEREKDVEKSRGNDGKRRLCRSEGGSRHLLDGARLEGEVAMERRARRSCGEGGCMAVRIALST